MLHWIATMPTPDRVLYSIIALYFTALLFTLLWAERQCLAVEEHYGE